MFPTLMSGRYAKGENITSCTVDGVTKTVSSSQCNLGNVGGGIDHIVEFTVKSGSLPSLFANANSAQYFITAIFDK